MTVTFEKKSKMKTQKQKLSKLNTGKKIKYLYKTEI